MVRNLEASNPNLKISKYENLTWTPTCPNRGTDRGSPGPEPGESDKKLMLSKFRMRKNSQVASLGYNPT